MPQNNVDGRDKRLPMLVTLLCMALVGCESRPSLGKVFGKVTFQGQPVTEGQIAFKDATQGIHMTAPLGPDGSYRVIRAEGEGLPPGTYQVAITPPPADLPVGYASTAPPPKRYRNIPDKYRNVSTSGLTLTVDKPSNQFDVEM